MTGLTECISPRANLKSLLNVTIPIFSAEKSHWNSVQNTLPIEEINLDATIFKIKL